MTTLLQTALANAVTVTLLSAIVWAVTRRWPSPRLAHVLWLVVLLKLVSPGLLSIPVPMPPLTQVPAMAGQAPAAPFTSQASNVRRAAPPDTSDRRPTGWNPLLLLLLSGSALYGLSVLQKSYRFGRLLSLARPGSQELQREIRLLSSRLGLSHCPRLVIAPGRFPPLLWPGRPCTIVLPRDLLERLSPNGLRTILCHELAHLKRRDHWIRFCELIPTALFWWHPAVWVARRGLREAEELCCDGLVIQTLPSLTRSYAGALLETLDFLAGAAAVPQPATGIGSITCLQRRLSMIVRRRPLPPATLSLRLLAPAFSLAILMVGLHPVEALSQAAKPVPVPSDPVRSEGSSATIQKQAERSVREARRALSRIQLQHKIEADIDVDVIVKEALQAAQVALKQVEIQSLEELEAIDIDAIVEEAMESVNIDAIVEKAMESVNIDAIVEEAMESVNIDAIIEKAFKDFETAESRPRKETKSSTGPEGTREKQNR